MRTPAFCDQPLTSEAKNSPVLNDCRRCCVLWKKVFVLLFPQEEYASEGLAWSFINYQDNQSCLDAIEGSPISLFSLLNEVGQKLGLFFFLFL